MKSFKLTVAIIISIIIMFSTLTTAFCANTNDENYAILLEHGFKEDYLDGLTDSMINKMATQIKKASDPEYISDYDFLLSLGVPEEFIKNLSETALNKLKSSLKDKEIAKLDYKQAETVTSDITVKKLSVQLIDKSDSTVIGETVCVYWEWPVNKPLIRTEDFISASWNKDVFCYDADSFYAEDYRRNTTNESWSVSNSYYELARSSLDSIGNWTKLYTTKKQVGGFMIFNLTPTQPINSSTDYDRDIHIEYSHETKSASVAALCIVFVLLILSALSVITRIRKRKKK